MITGIVSLQLMQFFMNVGSVSGTFGMMKKIAQIMDTDSEPDGGEPVPEVCADIEFDNVSFAYAGGQDVIKNLSVKIPMGKVTAVIGGNVRENIAYGLDHEVSDEELAETARRANFSGGQGQCIKRINNAEFVAKTQRRAAGGDMLRLPACEERICCGEVRGAVHPAP